MWGFLRNIFMFSFGTNRSETHPFYDEWCSSHYHEWRTYGRHLDSIESLAQSLASESSRILASGELSFNANGYVRHQAVRGLSRVHDGSELPYLLPRLNDWVEPIREDAKAFVEARLNDQYVPEIIHCLPLLGQIFKKSRTDHAALLRQVVELFVRPQHAAAWQQAIRYKDRDTRRAIVWLSLECAGANLDRLVAHGISSEDPVIRLRSARRVAECYAGETLKHRFQQLKCDPFAPVRREAFLLESQEFPDCARNIWSEALLDRVSTIRELARIRFRQLAHEPAQFYRDILANQPDFRIALIGLAETGGSEDIAVIRDRIHGFVAGRCSIVRAIARLKGVDGVSELMGYIRDSSPKVSRESRKSLQDQIAAVDFEHIFQIAATDPREHVCEQALGLIRDSGKWRGIPLLVRALGLSNAKARRIARESIESWWKPPDVNRNFTLPSAAELERLHQAIDTVRATADAAFLKWLEVQLPGLSKKREG